MSTIDKVIKQCFKDTKSGFMMIIFGGLFVVLLFSFGFTALVAPIATIVMVVGLYKILAYLFYKSLYSEEAKLYQMLPIPTEEIIISRIFVGIVAYVTFIIMTAGSVFVGTAFLFSNFDDVSFMDEIFLVAYDAGIAAFVSYVIIYLIYIALEIVFIFAAVTFFNTDAKEKGFLRALIIIGMIVGLRIASMLLTSLLTIIAAGEIIIYYIAAIIMMAASICVIWLCCRFIKKRLENNLQL